MYMGDGFGRIVMISVSNKIILAMETRFWPKSLQFGEKEIL